MDDNSTLRDILAGGLRADPYAPYALLGRQIRAELDREHEAVAFLEARGYKVIKREAP